MSSGQTGTLKLSDGRVLGWEEMGDRHGKPVLAFHGAPACRLLFGPASEPAQCHGLRLIAPDRPGYGLSTPHPGRTLASWADDVASLMRHLGIETAPIVGISGGGPYAVSTAARLGARISALALVSPLGEIGVPEAVAMTHRGQRSFFLGLPRLPRLLRRSSLMARVAFLAAPNMSIASFAATLSPADRRILADPNPAG